METVIAIGVLALLLTAFLAVFGPATQGIRKAISVQEADRLAYSLEQELVTVREGEGYETGFEKAYEWIKASSNLNDAVLVYQYRGRTDGLRSDGTPEPFSGQGVAGEDFVVQPMVRKRSDPLIQDDLKALEGRVYVTKLTQLVYGSDQLEKGTPGEIKDPTPGDGDTGDPSDPETYPEAVIAFATEFFISPNSDPNYISGSGLSSFFDKMNLADNNKARAVPVFTRNLAVRR